MVQSGPSETSLSPERHLGVPSDLKINALSVSDVEGGGVMGPKCLLVSWNALRAVYLHHP